MGYKFRDLQKIETHLLRFVNQTETKLPKATYRVNMITATIEKNRRIHHRPLTYNVSFRSSYKISVHRTAF